MAAAAVLLAVVAAAPVVRATDDAADLTGRDVIARMHDARALGADDAAKLLHVTLVGADGVATGQTIATYQRRCGDETRSLMLFREPADVAGTALLTWAHPDGAADMWLFLPELGRIRQMNAAARGESFMGSDLTYEDLSGNHVDVRSHRLLDEEEIDGRRTYKVESVPIGDGPYARVLTWVDRELFLPVRIKYFDRASEHLKTGTFSDVRLVRGIPTIFRFIMQNVQNAHRTEIALLDADYHDGLDCERLTRRYLSRLP